MFMRVLHIHTPPWPPIMIGNFNLLIDSSSSDVKQLSHSVESFNLHQYVDFPTHINGHSLDLKICSTGFNVLWVSTSDLISDHIYVVADLQIPSNHSRIVPQTIKYRKLQAISIEAFKADIKNSELIRYPKTNATGLAQQDDSILHTLIDVHTSLVTKMISPKPPNPWMTPAILASKRHCGCLEHVWRRNQTSLNRSRLARKTHLCNRQMSKAKSAENSTIIPEQSGDHGSSWKAFNKIIHHCPKMHFPDHFSIAALANTFSSFVFNKIFVIRFSFPSELYSWALNAPEYTSVWPSSPLPIVIRTPDDPLMLRNYLIDSAVEHQSGLTRHWAWLAGDIGAIEN